jgi:sialidase-1
MRAFLMLLIAASALYARGPRIIQVDVAVGGEGGYFAYRIPSVVTTARGTLVALFEGRKNDVNDSGDIDTLVSRSFDNGKAWTKHLVIADWGPETIGNPNTLIDRKTGTIWAFLSAHQARFPQKLIIAGKDSIHILVVKSTDDGAHWTKPVDITTRIAGRDQGQTFFTCGPGTGIQLASGRLVVPVYYRWRGNDTSYAAAMYSDDGGTSWTVGKPAGEFTNEGQLAELPNGSLIYNMRSYAGRNRRAVSLSRDGGATWTQPVLNEMLVEPICQAGMVRYKGSSLLFSNPADIKRDNMSVRLSYDEGRTWPVVRSLYSGPSAYSSLTVLKDGTVGCLYERGEKGPYEKLTFARINLEWLAENQRARTH